MLMGNWDVLRAGKTWVVLAARHWWQLDVVRTGHAGRRVVRG
jgi:hypothetical protein